jgi:hypothetical protein
MTAARTAHAPNYWAFPGRAQSCYDRRCATLPVLRQTELPGGLDVVHIDIHRALQKLGPEVKVPLVDLGTTLVRAMLAALFGAGLDQIVSLFTQPVHGKR